jgi:pimeloyl-ACP methyl ester carboxylesterase
MDAAGVKRAALVGLSEGGPAAIVFAASRPDRVHSLILIGTGITSVFRSWDEVYGPIEPILQRFRAEFDDRYVPSVQAISRLQQMGRSIKEGWGTGDAMEYLLPSVSRIQLGLLERMSASPGMAIATMEAGMRIDVRSVLPTISVPTLVLHAKDDLVPIEGGRSVADHIPGARIVEFDGRDHAPWLSRPDVVLKEVEELLTGSHHVPPPRRALRSVLFTDLVASTEHASAMGDERWRDLLGRFQEVTAEALRDANVA